jgi:hypothetical protein
MPMSKIAYTKSESSIRPGGRGKDKTAINLGDHISGIFSRITRFRDWREEGGEHKAEEKLQIHPSSAGADFF